MSERATSPKKHPLGRGLHALMPDAPRLDAPAERRVPVSEIHPNPRQPRRFFDERKIAELADSVRGQGILQPLVVRKVTRGYELILGERRFRAAQRAGMKQVPVIVKEASDAESLEMALVENIQREELTPIEEALAYRQLMEEFDLTQEQVAKRVGKSRPAVTNLLRVLNLPGEIRESVDTGSLTVGHARALLALDVPAEQLLIARRIIENGLSVRETESLVARSTVEDETNGSPTSRDTTKATGLDVFLTAVQDGLVRALGTKVTLVPRRKGGRIHIDYYSNEELEGLVKRLKG